MRNLIALIIICIFAFSCGTDTSEKKLCSETDTIINFNKTWVFDTARLSNYKSTELAETYQFGAQETFDDPSVTRQGLNLVFTLLNGDTLTLSNDTSDSDAYVSFLYCKKLKALNHWLINGIYYEWNQAEIISCANGARTPVLGYPLFSPDNKHFICGSFDESGEGMNGIELYEIKGTTIKLLMRRELRIWGPSRLGWIDNDSVLIERYFMLNSKPGYVKTCITPRP